MNKKILAVTAIFACFSLTALFAQSSSTPPAPSSGSAVQAQAPAGNNGIKYVAAALAVGLACIGGGIAVGKIGAAAMGAMSENPDLSGKALPFVGLAEGICLWGFLVALLVIIM
ncbi:MAG: ATP synthase subunit C [Treponema sp.]|nr:ATP synthase subunit C [Treponema sp.]